MIIFMIEYIEVLLDGALIISQYALNAYLTGM